MGVVWGNTNEGKGYDLVLMGQNQPSKIDVDAIQARLQRPEYAADGEIAARDRHELRRRSVLDLRRAQAGSRAVAARCHAEPRIAICGCSISPASA